MLDIPQSRPTLYIGDTNYPVFYGQAKNILDNYLGTPEILSKVLILFLSQLNDV